MIAPHLCLSGEYMRLHGKPIRSDSYIPTGRLWPSGDFSVGFRRVEGDRRARVDTRNTGQMIDDGDMALPDDRWGYGRYGVPRLVEPLAPGERWADADAWAVEPGGAATPLTLANLSNSHKGVARRGQYGLKGMTGYGKKMVRSAATMIQRWAKPGRTTFCTISLPDCSKDQRVGIATAWPEYLRQLIQWLVRRLESLGLPPAVCSVSEIQPKRLKDGGRAYLHLHLVWPNHPARCGNWACDAREIRAWSESFMIRRGLLPDGGWVRVNVQPVRKSAGGYLSKYMSKGAPEIAAMAEDLGIEAIPRQWWNLSKTARDWVKGEMVHGDNVGALVLALVDAVFARAVEFRRVFYSLHEVVLELDGLTRGVGWRGAMTELGRKELLSLLDIAA